MFIAPKFSPSAQADRQRQAERRAFLLSVQAEAEKYGPIGSPAYRREAKRLIQGGRPRLTHRPLIVVV